MRIVFVDTSFLLALAFRRDEHHEKALRLQQAYTGRLLTTEFVMVEFLDAMAPAAFRALGAAIWLRLANDPVTTVVPATTKVLSAGRQLYDARGDKDWGVTDCVSFAVMREYGITEAFTADHHFEQAGLKALLRE
jgi:predicted nucleic acid-binding protein